MAITPPTRIEDPEYLDPQAPLNAFTYQMELFRCCLLRTLLSYPGRPTEEGGAQLRPDLAATMPEVAPDGLTWTFRLRQGLHYAPPMQDWEIVAADIVRAIQRSAAAHVSQGAYGAYFGVIDGYDNFAAGATDTIPGLEVVDPHTLRVHLTEVTGDFAYRMALPASAPIPPSPVDPAAELGVAEGHDDGYGRYLIASGPYMVEGAERLDPSLPPGQQPSASGITQQSLTLVRNPSWSRSTDPLRGAHVDIIRMLAMSLPRAAEATDEGSIDLIFSASSPPAQIDRYLATPALSNRVFRYPADFFVGYTALNLALPPFDDIQVRKAVNLAFDEEAFSRVANEQGYEQLGFVRFTPFGHIGPDGTEANLLKDYDPYPFDLDAARREMAASRYDHDGDGVCDDAVCRGVRALDTFLGAEPQLEKVWIRGLRDIGITLSIKRIPDLFRFLEVSLDPSRKIAMNLGMFWFADYPNATPLFTSHFQAAGIGGVFFGNATLLGATSGQLERWGYSVTHVPSVDAEIERCSALLGFAQTRCWAELDQRLMLEIVPWVPQNDLEYAAIVSERVIEFSIDQSVGAFPAPDQILLRSGSS